MIARRRLAGAVVLAGLAGAGLWWFGVHRQPAAGGSTLVLYGNVDIREIQPAFNDSDVVTEMIVSEGARVKKGQLIARIDDSRYAARLAQARQQADSLKATLAKLVNGSRPEEIAQAKATMDGLRAVYENNKILYDRTVGLVPRGAASTEDRDNALAQLNASRETYEAAKQVYVLAVKGPRAEDIAAARTAYEAAAAAATLAEREFADTRLYAPADGIVEDRILEPGDMASPSTPVYTIALTQPLWVRAYVSETDLGKLALGQPATVTTDSFPGHGYRGWVGYIAPTAEFTPKTVETTELRTRLVYQVRIYVCNSRDQLRLGMPATVTVDLSQPARLARQTQSLAAEPPPAGNAAALKCGADDAARP
ncbi:MAG: efflux RND transporter periplasmic adaptor subunit [Magnetospirillum sp.]|nr:efflux RND transporter periplasmic adaptor subunit [Magnetospirillum sp.]